MIIALSLLQGLGFGCVNKIFLKFPYRWWPEEHFGFSLLWTDEDLRSFKPSGDTGEVRIICIDTGLENVVGAKNGGLLQCDDAS
jgi:hypothetical protein